MDFNNLKFQGNCIKGSRHLLSFDGGFKADSITESIKLIFGLAFNVPLMHPKSKPCIDHVLAFNVLGERVSVRNYQIFREMRNRKSDVKELFEIGPRMDLRPVAVLEGAMCGRVLFRAEKKVKEVRVWKLKHRRRAGG